MGEIKLEKEREKKKVKKRKERGKKERDIKHNEKDTFTPPFNGKRERWVTTI